MLFLDPFKAGLRPAALILMALAGPLAVASVTVAPQVGDVDSIRLFAFQVKSQGGREVPADYSVVAKAADGTWTPVEPGLAKGEGGCWQSDDQVHFRYQAPAVDRLTVYYFQISPLAPGEAAVRVPIRVWPTLAAPPEDTQATASKPAKKGRVSDQGLTRPPSNSREAILKRQSGPGPSRDQRQVAPVQDTDVRVEVQREGTPTGPSSSSPAKTWRSGQDTGSMVHGTAPGATLDSISFETTPSQDPLQEVSRNLADLLALAGESPDLPERQMLRRCTSSDEPVHRRNLKSMTEADLVAAIDDPSKTIGSGANGTVCIVPTAQGDLAAKSIPTVQASDTRKGGAAEGLRRMQAMAREAQQMKELSHPNIIKFVDFKVYPANCYLFMELAEQSLTKTIQARGGRLPETAIRTYTRQILEGLHHLHERGLIHGDLKADNILKFKDGVMKVADLGSVRRLPSTEAGLPSTLAGSTPLWASPERHTPGLTFNQKADIWSLGCVVIEMLCGQEPWSELQLNSQSRASRAITQAKQGPLVPEHASPALRALLERCFLRHPDQRPAAGDLLQDPYFMEPEPEAKPAACGCALM